VAHFIVEYSANLPADALAVKSLLKKLVEAAVDTKLFPVAGIRARAHRCEDYYIASGDDGFGFVHLEVKLGAGRTDDEKKSAGETFLSVLTTHLQALYDDQGLAISFEMSELPAIKANKNNLREYINS
jgi:5-carboxymethyl-2-hydroxymuconate isomerase